MLIICNLISENLNVCQEHSREFSDESENRNLSKQAQHWRHVQMNSFFVISSTNNFLNSIFGQNSDKKPTANDIFVYTVNKCENRLKVIKLSIAELWQQNYKLRINNIHDKAKKANDDKEIKSQVRCN